MQDPGPNTVEQLIKANELLAAILAAAGGPAPNAGSSPGVSGGGRSQWPTLFAWSDGLHHPFNITGDAGFSVEVVTPEPGFLSPDSVIKVIVPKGTGSGAKLAIQPPMGLNLTPRIQLAWMSQHWPTACRIIIEMLYDNGVNLLSSGIELDQFDQSLKVLNDAGVYTELGTKLFNWNPLDWTKADLSVNFAEGKYSYAAVNGTGYDISVANLKSGATSTIKRLMLTMEIKNSSADDPNECYLDEILVTDELYTGPPA
ncbi:hypothetical protein ES703_101660 [subsurface metagenome]